jgi:2-dehydropantoate 2-reductase
MGLNVGIIGAGAVGGYFGGKLCRQISEQGLKVFFIARGHHLDAIRRNGLLVQTAKEGDWICHPNLATDDFRDLPALDVCLVCVKGYDLPQAVRQLRQCISETTAIIPLLNGIDIYERLREELDIARIFPACTYIGAQIAAPGVVAQRGGDCRILFGGDPQAAGIRPHLVFELFEQSGIGYEWLDDPSSALWRKYIFIAAFGIVQAGFDKTLGQVMETPQLSGYVQAVMREITMLAREKGVDLPADVVEQSFEHGLSFAYKTKTSFQRDFEKEDKPDERDLFTGTILRLGTRLGIEVPVTRELQRLLEQRKPS